MNWLQILAITLQLLDAGNTCRLLRTGKFYEANPILGRNPACSTLFAVKSAALVPMFVAPKGKWRTTITVGNIVAGGVGMSVSLWNTRGK